jgi:hypothetical protein
MSWAVAAWAGDDTAIEPEVGLHGQTHSLPSDAAPQPLTPGPMVPWPKSARAPRPEVASQPPPATTASPQSANTEPAIAKPTPPQPGGVEPARTAAATAATGDTALSQSPLSVMRWSMNGTVEQRPNGDLTIATAAGRPLYLQFTIDGGQAAVDRLQNGDRLVIEVHWVRAGDAATAGAPNLSTELTVGRPELAPLFASQVQKQGHFEWHLWARKDVLSPGHWTVTLTYPDGAPVQCGQAQPRPCRLAVNAS